MNLYAYSTLLAKQAFQTPWLQQMFNKKISKDSLKFFIAQKIRISNNFQRLLAVGIENAKQRGDHDLAAVLEQNLRDEQGIDGNGVLHVENSHPYWLSCFLKALNINPSSLADTAITSAQAHCDFMLELEREGDPLKIVGAVLMIERIVPLEYRSVQKSRDYCLAETFVSTPEDSIEVQEQKKLACKYIDDHVTHDAAEHFPALLRELQKYENDSEAMSCIKEGMELLTQARLNFFNEVASLRSDLYDKTLALAI